MEVVGRRVSREKSVVREKMRVEVEARPTFKKVQIIYYLSRNGHLQHPHFMELTLPAHQHLRLKDVVDRLTVLRGKGMPSLYSWSCKRSYKNGFVWNDLAENDVIFPSHEAEYVLKGSELIQGSTEKSRHLHAGGNVHVELDSTNFIESKRSSQAFETEQMIKNQHNDEYEEKACYTSSTTTRGVSTEETEEFKQPKTSNHAESSLDANSFSSTTSSTVSEKSSISRRFEDGDRVGNEPLLSRNSMLLSLIACGGGSASFRKETTDDEDKVMIGSMSENPRFGKEEKEYFSGSIVEAVAMDDHRTEGEGLKKSSSHNQERSGMVGLGEAADEEVEVEVEVQKRKEVIKVKCMPLPLKISSKK